MTSIAYLGGGGDAEQEATVWRAMLVARPRILYWPFALEPERLADAETWFRGSVQTHQRDLHVEVWTSLQGHRRAELDAFGLLFIGGGNTYDLLAHLRAHDALAWVRSFLVGGAAVYGGSAGAVLLGSTIAIAEGHDPNTTGLRTPEELAGLGLLPRHAVLPHDTDDQQDHAQRWSAEHGLEVLGVPRPRASSSGTTSSPWSATARCGGSPSARRRRSRRAGPSAPSTTRRDRLLRRRT